MEFKQLLYFVTAADEGSVSAAARKLYLSQPPLSLQLQQLEAEMGCRLFDRGVRGIRLTPAGKTLYRYAHEMLDIRRVAEEEVHYSAERGTAVIRLGIVSSLVSPALSAWIAPFCRQNPTLRLEITEDNTYRLLEKLRTDLLQLALIRTPFSARDLEGETLAADELVALGLEQWLPNQTVRWEDLSRTPLLLYRRWEKIVSRQMEELGLTVRCRCINDDARTTAEMAALGMGVALLPQSAVAGVGKDLCCRRFAERALTSQIVLEQHGRQAAGVEVQRLCAYIRKNSAALQQMS